MTTISAAYVLTEEKRHALDGKPLDWEGVWVYLFWPFSQKYMVEPEETQIQGVWIQAHFKVQNLLMS